MPDVVIFGGTTEGRFLAEYCGRAWFSTVVCVATSQGEESFTPAPSVSFRVGRMDADQISEFLIETRAKVVVDATHPFAAEITANVAEAATHSGLPLIRVHRQGNTTSAADQAHHFQDLDSLIDWINTTQGIIFATTGAKEAQALTRVNDFSERIHLRILPVANSVAHCISLGYPTSHIIAMQGPFSEELNCAMFRQTGASILITKDSGDAGGLPEKLNAARACAMEIAVVNRPDAPVGVTLEQACTMVTRTLQ